jgi:nitrite reductase/ring-hydroxylating ferredoxin subunit
VSENKADSVAVGSVDQITDGNYMIAQAGEFSVLLAKLDGAFHAIENRCSHIGSPLDGGRMKRGRITCPLHGATYDVRTGASLATTLAPRSLRTFETFVEDGLVWVRVR